MFGPGIEEGTIRRIIKVSIVLQCLFLIRNDDLIEVSQDRLTLHL